VETLKAMKLRYPKSDAARREELEAIRAALERERQ